MALEISHEQVATPVTGSPIKIHKLSHLVVEVSNLERSIDFWTRVMGFEISDTNERGLVFLHNGLDHHTIGLIESAEKTHRRDTDSVQVQHFAFEVPGGLDRLFEIRQFLIDQNVQIDFEGRHGAGGNIDLAFRDPDGYVIEINCGMDHPNSEGNYRPPSQFHRVNSLEEAAAHPLPDQW